MLYVYTCLWQPHPNLFIPQAFFFHLRSVKCLCFSHWALFTLLLFRGIRTCVLNCSYLRFCQALLNFFSPWVCVVSLSLPIMWICYPVVLNGVFLTKTSPVPDLHHLQFRINSHYESSCVCFLLSVMTKGFFSLLQASESWSKCMNPGCLKQFFPFAGPFLPASISLSVVHKVSSSLSRISRALCAQVHAMNPESSNNKVWQKLIALIFTR